MNKRDLIAVRHCRVPGLTWADLSLESGAGPGFKCYFHERINWNARLVIDGYTPAVNGAEAGSGARVPLWMFRFLY